MPAALHQNHCPPSRTSAAEEKPQRMTDLPPLQKRSPWRRWTYCQCTSPDPSSSLIRPVQYLLQYSHHHNIKLSQYIFLCVSRCNVTAHKKVKVATGYPSSNWKRVVQKFSNIPRRLGVNLLATYQSVCFTGIEVIQPQIKRQINLVQNIGDFRRRQLTNPTPLMIAGAV